ncbi:MAG TPA: hypothetical protein VFF29_05855 [Bacteroidota bacterium]|nr:hypothetical protein [Bacteroidota bacterium]
MIVTLLATAFLILMALVALFGYKILVKPNTSVEGLNTEQCTICRKKFTKDQLILRQIGDYKLLFFCQNCVMGLYSEISVKN